MRVTIKREDEQVREKVSMFKTNTYTNYKVVFSVQFSETELAIIKTTKLGNYSVYEIQMNLAVTGPYLYRLTIDDLLKKPETARGFRTPLEASNFENELKTEILPRLKDFIAGNTTREPTSETFEM